MWNFPFGEPFCGATSWLVQDHQTQIWRRQKNISDVALTSSLSEERYARKQDRSKILDRRDLFGDRDHYYIKS